MQFSTASCGLCATAIGSKFGVLEAFARANASRVLAVIRKRAYVWKFRPSVFLIIKPSKELKDLLNADSTPEQSGPQEASSG